MKCSTGFLKIGTKMSIMNDFKVIKLSPAPAKKKIPSLEDEMKC